MTAPAHDPAAPAEARTGPAHDPTAVVPGADSPAGVAPPGARDRAPELAAAITRSWAERAPGTVPRTHHKRPDGSPMFANRLALETSPYLQQHAHNPVDWYPWGEEAFAAAKATGRPILLSIGYSTCHWCHVMEEESFEDLEIAQLMNERYIPIKVDREERPDVDAVYMAAVQALTGGGGWPMTVWLDADRRPFHGATYIPARDGDRGVRAGFLTMLVAIADVHRNEPDRVDAGATRLTEAVREIVGSEQRGELPQTGPLQAAAAFYVANHDPVRGGMNRAPKFPSSLPVRFLLRHARRSGDEAARDIALLTLRKMAAGGMYDQAAGGFHRYSVDADWLVPHFEKMLYDNALLAVAYLEGWQQTGEARYLRIAQEVLAYVQREMTAPGGAFFSATDADSLNLEGHRDEGFYFTWTPDELVAALGADDAAYAAEIYGVAPGGNFEGRTILNTSELREADPRLDAIRRKLVVERNLRPHPIRDDKVLLAWNGLMISAFARVGAATGDAAGMQVAATAADFLWEQARVGDRFTRTWKDGRARHDGMLADQAFQLAAQIDLLEATGEAKWLARALAIDAAIQAHYEDPRGGWFSTPDDGETLLARERPDYDGAEPTGTSVQLMNLERLGALTGDDSYRVRAEAGYTSVGAALARNPVALSEALLALDFRTTRPLEVVIAAGDGEAELVAAARQGFRPSQVIVVVREAERPELERLAPPLAGKAARDGQATAYVCEHGLCQQPTSDPAVLRTQIDRLAPYEG